MLVSSCCSFGICLTWSICRLSTSKVGWTEIDGQTISDEGTGGDTTSAIEKQRRSPSQTEPCPSDSTASIWNFWLLESVTVRHQNNQSSVLQTNWNTEYWLPRNAMPVGPTVTIPFVGQMWMAQFSHNMTDPAWVPVPGVWFARQTCSESNNQP